MEQEQTLVFLLFTFISCFNSEVLGTFNLHVKVEYLFFIGSQLVALSPSGKLGVWHAMTQHWQTQDVVPIASFDTAGSFLLLGCNNGCIYYIGKCVLAFLSLSFTSESFRYAKIPFAHEG